MSILYLAYHYTANKWDTAAGNVHYFQNPLARPASAHYFVDDDTVINSVDDLLVAYAVGGKKYSDTHLTGGGKFYGIVTNYNSISIEMCGIEKDGQIVATEATMQRAAELGRALMEKYNIPIDRVVRHFDVTGKYCPKYFMDDTAWERFKSRLTAQEEEDMKLYHYVSEMPEWSRNAVTKAINAGIVDMDNESGAVNIWEPNLQTIVWMDRAGMLDKPAIKP